MQNLYPSLEAIRRRDQKPRLPHRTKSSRTPGRDFRELARPQISTYVYIISLFVSITLNSHPEKAEKRMERVSDQIREGIYSISEVPGSG